MGRKVCWRQGAFTLVELVVILLLLGIASVYVVSRLASPSRFQSAAASDGVVAVARAAQQMALGRDDVSFQIDSSGNAWLITARQNAGAEILREIEMPGTVVMTTGSAYESAANCGDPAFADAVNSLQVSFDSYGNIREFSNAGDPPQDDNSLMNGVRICVDGARLPVCISPAGFAHEGDCDD